eukprot:Lankesteria_metandrocarpae@DN5361_c0_g1_i1.p1
MSANASRSGPSHRPISYHPKPSPGDEGDERNNHGVNVKVIVRVRPVVENERKDGAQFNVLQAKADTREVVVAQTIPGGRKAEAYSKTFCFDGVCTQFATQEDVFHSHILPIVDEVLQGFNCTIFAYGQTGTGKTYTMEGDVAVRPLSIDCSTQLTGSTVVPVSGKYTLSKGAGIIPRAVQRVFDCLEKQNAEYSVKVSYLEIYNEELHDLLNDERQNMRIFDDPSGKKGLSVDKLEEVSVNNPQDILNILSTAVKKRRTAETLLNRMSSRSHCIFSITIHIKEPSIEGEDVIKVGKLNLVDLAGSENIQRSGAVKDRAKEAGMINQSLLTLGRVINALVEHSSYVPYRDSKLTRLLQESLGGRTKTLIVATVSPSSLCLEETLSTLDYAHRAKNIRNRPEVNQRMTKRIMVKELTTEIDRLKVELLANREKNGVYLPPEKFTEMEAQLAGQSTNLHDFENQMRTMQDELNASKLKVSELRLAVESADAAVVRVEQVLRHTTVTLDTTEASLAKKEKELTASRDVLRSVRRSEVHFCGVVHKLTDFLRESLDTMSRLWTVSDNHRMRSLTDGRAACLAGEMLISCAVSLAKVAEQLACWEVESQRRMHAVDEEFQTKLQLASDEQCSQINMMQAASERTSEGLLKLFNDFSKSVVQPNGEALKCWTSSKLQSFQNVLQEGHSSVSSHLQLCRAHVDSCTDLVERHSVQLQEQIDCCLLAAAHGHKGLYDSQLNLKATVASLDAQRKTQCSNIQILDGELSSSLHSAVNAVSEKLTSQVATLMEEFKVLIADHATQRSSTLSAKLAAVDQLTVVDHTDFGTAYRATVSYGEAQKLSLEDSIDHMKHTGISLQKNFVSETAAIREALSTTVSTVTGLPPKYKSFCKDYTTELRLLNDTETTLANLQSSLEEARSAQLKSTANLQHAVVDGGFKTCTTWLRESVKHQEAASQQVVKLSAEAVKVDSNRIALVASELHRQQPRVETDVYAEQRDAVIGWLGFAGPSVPSIVHHELLDVHHIPEAQLSVCMSSSPPVLSTDMRSVPPIALDEEVASSVRPVATPTASCSSVVATDRLATTTGSQMGGSPQQPLNETQQQDSGKSSKTSTEEGFAESECDTQSTELIDDHESNRGDDENILSSNRTALHSGRSTAQPFSINRKTRLRSFGFPAADVVSSPRKLGGVYSPRKVVSRGSSSRLKRKSPQPDSCAAAGVDCELTHTSDRKMSRIGSATRSSAAQKKSSSEMQIGVTSIPTKRSSARRA